MSNLRKKLINEGLNKTAGEKYKAKIKAEVIMTVYMSEDVQGNQEIEDIDEVEDVLDYSIINRIQ